MNVDLPSSNVPVQPRRARWLERGHWRFTIREILLLTAAVAAFIAWLTLLYERSRLYQRTPIPDQVGNFSDLQSLCRSLGHESPSYTAGGGGSSGMHGTTRTYECQVNLPLTLRGPFMQEYRKRIRAVLDKHADRVTGAGTSSDGAGLRGFDFEYNKGSTHGTVAVRSASSEHKVTMLIFVHESDTRP